MTLLKARSKFLQFGKFVRVWVEQVKKRQKFSLVMQHGSRRKQQEMACFARIGNATKCLVQGPGDNSVGFVDDHDSRRAMLVRRDLLVAPDVNVLEIESAREFVAPLRDQQSRNEHSSMLTSSI